MATPHSSLPDLQLAPATECEAYLRSVRAELCRITGEQFASVTVSLNCEGKGITWSTYTDATTHIHTKTPQGGLCAHYEAKRSGVHPRVTS